MKKTYLFLLMFVFSLISSVFSQTVSPVSKEKEIIGSWRWFSVTTTDKESGKSVVQSEYIPGLAASHFRMFKIDHSVELIDFIPMSDNNINNGTWNMVKDTIYIKWDKRIVTAAYSIENDKLFLNYLKVTDTDFVNDYTKSKAKVIEEYHKE